MWFLVLLTHCFIYFIFNVLCTLGPRRQKNIKDQELHREKREKDQEVGPFLLNMVLGNQKVHQERRKKGKEAIHFHQSMACGDQINTNMTEKNLGMPNFDYATRFMFTVI